MTSLLTRLRSTADALLAVLLAPSCVACGTSLEHATDGPVCAVCWLSLVPLTPPLCDTCGSPLPTWRTDGSQGLCARCRRLHPAVTRTRSVGAYDGALRAIVHALKYDARRSLAVSLGPLMRARGADVLRGADAAVPVPLHPSRRRSRGFNQADDLARQLGLPVVHALRRTRATATQLALPAARRHANVRDAFAPTRAAAGLHGSVVVLVDDVSTTGATLEACARALRSAGVRDVRALTVARTLSRETTGTLEMIGNASALGGRLPRRV